MSKRFLVGAGITALVVVSLGICLNYWERKSADSVHATITQADVREFAAKLGRTNQPTPSAPAPLPLSRPVRLAIGSLGLADDDQNRQLDDLITAELTGARGFNLVERQSLDAILKEMNLSLSGLVRARDAVRVGKLVRADWFLLGTPTTLHGINSMVVRLVDARTGVMLDGGVFAQKAVPELAADLAGFVRQSRQAAAEGRPRMYLAIGAFGDVSVNNRQADFPTQLRGYLIAAYQHSKVTLLEREYVDILQQEMRLDLAGLTEGGGTNAPVPMQSAFWLVGGFYQSYETSGLELELNLNIEHFFEHTVVFGKKPIVLRGQPGEPIFKKVKNAIDGAMSKDVVVFAPTRVSEAGAQLEAGKELMESMSGDLVYLNNYRELDEPSAAKQRRNAEEAMRALETALLLDPGNREAKMYLAACLRAPTIGQIEEARNYYREIIESSIQDKWSKLARMALRASFEEARTSPEEQIRWLEAATEHGTNSSAAEYFRREAEAARTNAVLNSEGSKAQELAAARILDNITNSWLGNATSENAGIGDFVKTFGTNQAAAAQRLVELYPKLKTQAPELAPYLLALFVTVQVDTNSPVVVEFQQMLEQLVQHPDQVFKPDKFWWDIWLTYKWSCDHKLYGMAARILEGKIRAAALYPKHVWGIRNEDKLGLAFAYLGMEQWDKALKIFETYSNQPVQMGNNGPWGQMFSILLTSRQTAYCRQKLGLPAVRNPLEFDLGKPVARLGRFATFTADATGLWFGIDGQLLHSDFDLKNNLAVNLPDPFAPVTVLCISPSTVWIGTAGAGLIEFDKATHKVRQLTEKDGLMMDFISSLALTGDTLWIGYGGSTGGGLGQLDFRSQKIKSFMRSLNADSSSGAGEAPPRDGIGNIVAGTDGDLWMSVGRGIRQFHVARNSWGSLPNKGGNWITCFSADSERLVEGVDISQTEAEIEIESKSNYTGRTNQIEKTRRVISSREELDQLEANFKTNGNHQRIIGYFSGKTRHKGGLAVKSLRDNRWQNLVDAEGLPNRPTTMTLDGNDLWVGGEGFITLVDLTEYKIRKFCHIQATGVDRIQIGGGYVWVQFGWDLYRAPLASMR